MIILLIFCLQIQTIVSLHSRNSANLKCAWQTDIKKNATIVDCSNLELTEIPDDIPASTTHLDVSGNYLKTLTDKTLSSFQNLQVLDASNNLLQKLDVDAFKLTPTLQSLNLARNHLKWDDSIPLGVFKPLGKSLLHLDISQNLDDTNSTYPDGALADLSSLQVLKMDCLNGKIYCFLLLPMMCKSKSGLGLDLDLSPIFIENGLDLDLT